jgi:hypothetical protein
MTFAERPDLQPLYDDYGKRLFAAGFALVRPLKCAFGRKPKPTPKPKLSVKTAVQGALKRTLNATPAAIRKRLHQISGFIAENSEG